MESCHTDAFFMFTLTVNACLAANTIGAPVEAGPARALDHAVDREALLLVPPQAVDTVPGLELALGDPRPQLLVLLQADTR